MTSVARWTFYVLVATTLVFASPLADAAAAREINAQGLQALRAGRPTEAEQLFREAVKADQNNAIMNQNLGVALSDQGRYDEAITIFRGALEMRGTFAIIHRNLGHALFSKGRLPEAMEQYEKSLVINPAEPAMQRIIEVAFITGDSEKWIATFERDIKETSPDGKDGINKVFLREQAIIHSLLLQGKYDEAIARAGKGLEAIKGVQTESGGYVVPIITPFFFFIRSVPKGSINITPVIGGLHTLRGIGYLRKGMLDEAISELKSGTDADQRSIGGMYLGVALLEKGDAKEAVYQLRKFIESRPDLKQALVYYAIALKMNDEQAAGEEQLKRFEQSVKPVFNLDLKCHIDVLESLAWADLVWNRSDDAFKRFSQVVEWCPRCGRSLRGLARLYAEAGDKERAADYASKALVIIPTDPETQKLAASLAITATGKPAETQAPKAN